MSRLTDLLRQLHQEDPQLAADLASEVKVLTDRRAFGLNFERHMPETVDLPGRQVRKGDKVRFLAERGSKPVKGLDKQLWRVADVYTTSNVRTASLISRNANAGNVGIAERAVDDLVVVAEFRDAIYPGLKSTGKIEQGGDKPFHTVINAENFHALQTLLFAHEGQVDAIYIDPPYNTGAKDWKYNNDYVDGEDAYRHSKWLAFMERRLLLAKHLLKPEDSVLIVTIDEKEVHRLGLLVQQVFPGARTQMVSVAINPAAIARASEFRRADEYYFFVMLGAAGPSAASLGGDWVTSKGRTHRGEIRWDLLRRSAEGAARADRPGMFYPLFVSLEPVRVHSIGDPIPKDADRTAVEAPSGTVAVWPIRKDGTEGRWRLGAPSARQALAKGFIKVGSPKGENTPIYYLTVGEQQKIADGIYDIAGRAPDGSVITSTLGSDARRVVPATQWRIAAHDSTQYGSRLLLQLLPDRRFPFPKSLYAVEDALRFFVGDKPDSLVVDFFGGSGTTTHAVMRLNRQDGGRRRCILVTNNEVSADDQLGLRQRGLRPGDPDWEAMGICNLITKPRITAAVTGVSSAGTAVKGDYKFIDEFPMADGLQENVEFLDLTYEAPRSVAHNRSFAAIAPLLWLKAGARGRRIEVPTTTFDIADTYGVLFDLDAARPFLGVVAESDQVHMTFIVTDDDRRFQMVCAGLPRRVQPVRLYESYLTNFTINAGRD